MYVWGLLIDVKKTSVVLHHEIHFGMAKWVLHHLRSPHHMLPLLSVMTNIVILGRAKSFHCYRAIRLKNSELALELYTRLI
jgi:hypothetical protein